MGPVALLLLLLLLLLPPLPSSLPAVATKTGSGQACGVGGAAPPGG
jgi:hypothetical protein